VENARILNTFTYTVFPRVRFNLLINNDIEKYTADFKMRRELHRKYK
jgi:hypothetical protein